MSEHETSSTLTTLDDLLRCQVLVVDKHLFTKKGAEVASSRVKSLLIVGEEQVTQWIDEIRQDTFKQPPALVILQRAAMDQGTSFTKAQAGAAFGALKAMYADLVDMRTGDTETISKRHKGHRGDTWTSKKTKRMPPEVEPDEDERPVFTQVPHLPAARTAEQAMNILGEMSDVMEVERKTYLAALRPIMIVMNGDRRMKPERKDEIQRELEHLGATPENLYTWAQIRPR